MNIRAFRTLMHVHFVALFLIASVFTVAARAQDCNDLFDPGQILTLEITMIQAQWDSLRAACPEGVCPEPHVYTRAQLSCGSIGPMLVGIRRKNDKAEPSELDPQKVSLKLDINRFVPGQTFAGKKKLSLENGGEEALVSEGLAWQIYAAAGIVTGRSAWVEVHVNGDYKGLYSNVEQVDKTYLTDHGINDGGFLFKGEREGTPDEQRTREGEINPFRFNWYPFDHPYMDPPEEPAPADWREQTLWRVDVPQLLTLGAAENFIASIDGVVHKTNNFFYYDWSILPGDDPAGQQPRLYLPWDLDTTMRNQDTDLPLIEAGPGHMQQGLVDELDEAGVPFSAPTFQADYYQVYKDLLNGPLALQQLHTLIDAIEPVITPSMTADPYQTTGSPAEECERLRAFYDERMTFVVSELIDAGQGFPLETMVEGSGSIVRDPHKPTIYDVGEIVELTPEPELNWHFDHWTGDASGTANPLLVTMDQPRSITAVFAEGGVGIAEPEVTAQAALHLVTIRPNPFHPSTTITFRLGERAHVRLEIFDAHGRLVARPMDAVAASGTVDVRWDGRTDQGDAAASGVYFYRLAAGDERLVGRVMLVR